MGKVDTDVEMTDSLLQEQVHDFIHKTPVRSKTALQSQHQEEDGVMETNNRMTVEEDTKDKDKDNTITDCEPTELELNAARTLASLRVPWDPSY